MWKSIPSLRRSEKVLLFFSIFFIILSIVTWTAYPVVYTKMVQKNLIFKENYDESLSQSAFLCANPPMVNIMKFYFFNITNYQEMMYDGAKPRLVETGPYAVTESEHKKYIRFNEDGTEMFYENYKTYHWNQEESCDSCDFDDLVTIPNPTEVGTVADIIDERYGMKAPAQNIVTLALILLGENPFVTQSVRDILYDGYKDALLSFYHSNLMNLINGLLNGGKPIVTIPVPGMHKMGFFIGYNNSRDENYWIKTGKDNIEELGKVVTWGDRKELPESWWTTEYARSIRGADSGSFNKWHLQKTDVPELFNSFMCRSFNKKYIEDSEVHGIPSMTFSTPYEDYDTTLELNKGFRYHNGEKVNYCPSWPSCPGKNESNCDPTIPVDCSMKQNLCDDCCSGSFVNGTYLLPPGLFPLVCYPGNLQQTPFTVVYSPPHFLYSPQEMVDTSVGLAPDPKEHLPMVYDHEPTSGMVTQVRVRLQVSIPVSRSKLVPQNMQLPNVIVPIFWQGAHAVLKDFTYNTMWLGFVFVPKLVTALKYGFLVLGLFLFVLLVLMKLRRGKTGSISLRASRLDEKMD